MAIDDHKLSNKTNDHAWEQRNTMDWINRETYITRTFTAKTRKEALQNYEAASTLLSARKKKEDKVTFKRSDVM